MFFKVGESSLLALDVVNNFVLLVPLPLPLRVNNFNTLEFFMKPYRPHELLHKLITRCLPNSFNIKASNKYVGWVKIL